MIAHDLRRAGLNNILGTTGETNVQGEMVKKLDQIANDTFLRVFEHSGLVCVLASEEMEKPLTMVPEGAKYMLLVDPLDGSSNTDVNMPLGAIFSIRRSKPGQRQRVEDELLQKGTEQIAAGYLLYGASTMLVFTVGQGVHGFTLEPSIGEYLLSNENIRIPEKGKVYAVNEGNYHHWSAGTQTIHRVSKDRGQSDRAAIQWSLQRMFGGGRSSHHVGRRDLSVSGRDRQAGRKATADV